MALLFRGFRPSVLALPSASPLARSFGHERSASYRPMSTQAPRATILPIDLATSSTNSKPPPELQRLHRNAAILTQLHNQIQSLGNAPSSQRDAFYIVDTAADEDRYKLWQTHLTNVRPYYAVKCNPDPVFIESLARIGEGFDCARVVVEVVFEPVVEVFIQPIVETSLKDLYKQPLKAGMKSNDD
ncbi:hypothetical protein PsorP6_001113 [Peronosclerospora sorghi]|uniref:Uncharacterized protein n=1 Tax=Peronosclerospora sorghi TaxID=230839 RepID=A0ACC0WX38_9STRA|nr:hypothetical protein PsorP6_001113 [Peronosclerospora sorghi]